MACRDHLAEEDSRRELATNLHDRTRMLCALCTRLEDAWGDTKAQNFFVGIPGLVQWWEMHKALDEERRKEEKRRRSQEAEVLRSQIQDLQKKVAELEEQNLMEND